MIKKQSLVKSLTTITSFIFFTSIFLSGCTNLKEQATESLLHAQLAGEKIAGLDGHPSQNIARIEETNRHTIKDILEESLQHELHALNLYKKLLTAVEDKSIYLEEYARSQIGEEEQHSLELKIMLKDFS